MQKRHCFDVISFVEDIVIGLKIKPSSQLFLKYKLESIISNYLGYLMTIFRLLLGQSGSTIKALNFGSKSAGMATLLFWQKECQIQLKYLHHSVLRWFVRGKGFPPCSGSVSGSVSGSGSGSDIDDHIDANFSFQLEFERKFQPLNGLCGKCIS